MQPVVGACGLWVLSLPVPRYAATFLYKYIAVDATGDMWEEEEIRQVHVAPAGVVLKADVFRCDALTAVDAEFQQLNATLLSLDSNSDELATDMCSVVHQPQQHQTAGSPSKEYKHMQRSAHVPISLLSADVWATPTFSGKFSGSVIGVDCDGSGW